MIMRAAAHNNETTEASGKEVPEEREATKEK